MHRRHFLVSSAALGAAATLGRAQAAAPATLDDVFARERAFARTMADRDFEAFASFIDDEAEFLNGGRPLHGKAAILAFWKKQYEAVQAPFAWEPDQGVMLASGTLAQTEGPVRNPAGVVFSRFHSVWRRDAAGEWRIVFDNGYAVCG